MSKPSVLFVCVHNAGRSQMAAGFMRELGQGRVEVLSAGSAPKDSINPIAVEAMAELGIDIANNSPKILTPEAVQASDAVITMGCGDACPIIQWEGSSTSVNAGETIGTSGWRLRETNSESAIIERGGQQKSISINIEV